MEIYALSVRKYGIYCKIIFVQIYGIHLQNSKCKVIDKKLHDY